MNGQMEHLLLHTCVACLLYIAKTQRLPRNGSSVKKRNITKIVFVCYHYSWLQTTHLVCEIKTSNRNSKINHRPEVGYSFMYQFDAKKFNTYLSTDDQMKLEVMTKEFFDDWKDHSKTIEDGNQVN